MLGKDTPLLVTQNLVIKKYSRGDFIKNIKDAKSNKTRLKRIYFNF
jgi:hypothetical protein